MFSFLYFTNLMLLHVSIVLLEMWRHLPIYWFSWVFWELFLWMEITSLAARAQSSRKVCKANLFLAKFLSSIGRVSNQIFFLEEWRKWEITFTIPWGGLGKWGIVFFHSQGMRNKPFLLEVPQNFPNEYNYHNFFIRYCDPNRKLDGVR